MKQFVKLLFQNILSNSRAALDTKRQFIGIDISEEYCKLASERIKIHRWQPSLFEERMIAGEAEIPYHPLTAGKMD